MVPRALAALPARDPEPLAGAAHPFLLEAASAFIVEEGRVDLFSVRVVDGRPDGHRTHLMRIPAGGLALGFDPPLSEDGRGVLAVGTIGTRVAAVARESVAAMPATADGARDLLALVEPWIEALCGAIARSVPPSRSHELQAGEDITVAETVAARPRRHVAWVSHAEGSSHLLGNDALAIETHAFVPLSRHVWLEVQPGSRLRTADTTSLEPAEILAGLGRLSRLVLRAADLMAREAEAADRERLQHRVAFEESVLREACSFLTAAMPQPRAAVGVHGSAAVTTDDALLAACRVAGQALGIAIKPHPRVAGSAAPRDPLAAIARASRMRVRRVALRGRWWQHDYGPLVGTLAESKTPVALLPSPRGYVLHEAGVAPRRIDRALAAMVAPFAHTFYRPFQDATLRARQVASFALRGGGRDLWLLAAVSVAASILGMLPALVAGVFFNTLIPGAHRVELIQLSALLLACAGTAFLLNVAQGIVFLRIEARAGTAVQAAVWDRLLTLPLAFFRPYTAGDLAVRAMSMESIRQAIAGPTATTLIAGVSALGNAALMFYYSVELARWAIAILAVVAAVTLCAIVLQIRYYREALGLQARVSGLVLQLLSSIGKLRVAGVESSAFALWARRFTDQRRVQFRVRSMAGWVTSFHAAAPVLANLVIFWAARPLADQGLLRTGDFLGFLAAFTTCVLALVSSCLALVAVGTIAPLYDQARPILEAEPEVATTRADPGLLTGDIEIQHAAFRYTVDSPLVLRDLSLRIRPGEFMALVGPSGSGKSTLLRLLLGFEQLESGAIYFDGQDLSGLDVNVVRRQIGVVLQNGRLMSGDIFTNIVGSSTATLAEAWEAARMAGFAEDIEGMPMGMHTVIADGGGTLSGGQRQRLLIARAIVHRPRILLFDEATSALDNRTQAIVSASLERLQAARIVVAHRLSTIRNADRIYVLEHGTLMQSGPYEELMARDGPFAELARRQMV
ncbi:MAG TPA: NHLP bacteriocin export ABC transporter permease/ATPase subunit [Vicinamibacterales bacterium]